MSNNMSRRQPPKEVTSTRDTQIHVSSQGDRKVTFRTDDDLYRRLKLEAVNRQTSVAQILNDLIADYLSEN